MIGTTDGLLQISSSEGRVVGENIRFDGKIGDRPAIIDIPYDILWSEAANVADNLSALLGRGQDWILAAARAAMGAGRLTQSDDIYAMTLTESDFCRGSGATPFH